MCGNILSRFYDGKGFDWFSLAWLHKVHIEFLAIKMIWVFAKPYNAITTRYPFYEHHRRHAIELMKYKLYFDVSLDARNKWHFGQNCKVRYTVEHN